jgi:hypothetical protein
MRMNRAKNVRIDFMATPIGIGENSRACHTENR